MRQRGRPRHITGGKRLNIYLSAEQIEWLKRQEGGMSRAIQNLVDQKISQENDQSTELSSVMLRL